MLINLLRGIYANALSRIFNVSICQKDLSSLNGLKIALDSILAFYFQTQKKGVKTPSLHLKSNN